WRIAGGALPSGGRARARRSSWVPCLPSWRNSAGQLAAPSLASPRLGLRRLGEPGQQALEPRSDEPQRGGEQGQGPQAGVAGSEQADDDGPADQQLQPQVGGPLRRDGVRLLLRGNGA